jgi:hypothetical protein
LSFCRSWRVSFDDDDDDVGAGAGAGVFSFLSLVSLDELFRRGDMERDSLCIIFLIPVFLFIAALPR